MAISERTSRQVPAAASRNSTLLITDPACPEAVRDAYKETYLSIRFALLGGAGTGNCLLISAIDNSATAAPLAANLAILAARDGEQVLLVDADPYTPTLDGLFALRTSSGFTNLIRQENVDVRGMSQETDLAPTLRVIGAGSGGSIPGGLGRAPNLGEAMLRLKAAADRLILIGVPILTQVDTMDLCPLVDGVVITMTPGKTHRQDAARARQILDRVHAPLLGVVLGQPK